MKSNKVAYIYNKEIYDYQYTPEHPMKPKRIKMAESLIQNYKLFRQMHIYSPTKANSETLLRFHNSEYIKYLQKFIEPQDEQNAKSNPGKTNPQSTNTKGFRINPKDCPQFPGLYNFCQIPVGGTLDCAQLLCQQDFDIAINWAGGFHHGKKKYASGFCFINDIVIGILELLKVFQRVLYIDIDVHHGDGVSQAFYCTNRVMTISFHQYQQGFFPGTGGVNQVGAGLGENYCINVPLRAGIDDVSYFQIFKKITDEAFNIYRPEVFVVQCGADSLAKDLLGNFNLSVKGHGNCIKHLLNYKIKTILLGGGGYKIQNVARCWAYETGLALGKQLDQNIPQQDKFYHEYANDNYKLHFNVVQSKINKNSREYLQQLQSQLLSNLKKLEISPGIQINSKSSNLVDQIFQSESQNYDKIKKYRKIK